MSKCTIAAEETTDESPRRRVTTGTDAAIAAPIAAGVEHAIGLQGDVIRPVYDSLYRSDIEYPTMAHEQGVALVNDRVLISGGIDVETMNERAEVSR